MRRKWKVKIRKVIKDWQSINCVGDWKTDSIVFDVTYHDRSCDSIRHVYYHIIDVINEEMGGQ